MANATMFNGKVTLRVTKSGSLDKRNKFGALVEKLVQDEVDRALKESGLNPQSKKPIKKPDPFADWKKQRRKREKWITSNMGKAMTIMQGVSAGIRYNNVYQSGDEASTNRELFSTGVSSLTLAIGTFGGPYGMAVASVIAYLRGMFGQWIENSIQEKYDTRRLKTQISNYDLSKYSTQTYDYVSQKWRATDTERVSRAILGNTRIT